MDNITLTLIQAGAMISIFTFVFSSGLRMRPDDLTNFGQRRRLLAWSLLSVVVMVPLIAIPVIALVQPAKPTAIALLIIASSPASATMLKKYLRRTENRIMS